MLKVYTSNISYSGKDRLDTTVKTGDMTFAPTWDMVWGHKGGTLSDDEYKKKYIKMMKESLKTNKQQWDDLFSKETVTLVCYCKKGKFCHRLILAKILVMLGAEYKGEI